MGDILFTIWKYEWLLWILTLTIFIAGTPLYIAVTEHNYDYLWLWIGTIIVGAAIYDMFDSRIDEIF